MPRPVSLRLFALCFLFFFTTLSQAITIPERCRAEGSNGVIQADPEQPISICKAICAAEFSVSLACNAFTPNRVCSEHCTSKKADVCAGNPIELRSGTKLHTETDFRGGGRLPLSITRFYSSDPNMAQSVWGQNWMGQYRQHLVIKRVNAEHHEVLMIRPRGARERFRAETATPLSPGITSSIRFEIQAAENHDLLHYTQADGRVEIYRLDRVIDQKQPLLSIQHPNGHRLRLSYDTADPSRLVTVTDYFGRSLSYDHDNDGRIATITAPGDNLYQYAYDSLGNLVSVTYPDNSLKQYHYEDTQFPYALTGITDENGDRYATYGYDDSGRAILSEHAGGAERLEILGFDDLTTTRNALGKETRYHYEILNGWPRVSEVEGVASQNCAAASQANSYDANGFVTRSTDWNGNLTTRENNPRGLATLITEAADTEEARDITTQWHEQWSLPLAVIEPGKTTELRYDDQQQLIESKVIDTTEHTEPYATQGQTRITRFTYDTQGQLTAVDGPRTDVDDITRYRYDEQGNLTETTNALGQITRFSDYNPRGQAGKILDPNDIATLLSYDQRGRLRSSIVKTPGGDLKTQFLYDKAGQLTRVTRPDDSYLGYEYDAAHRLIALTNNAQERIEYTLDAAGNRLKTEIKDADGSLQQTQHGVYDELSRLIQTLGANPDRQNQLSYDANSNPLIATDAKGQQTRQVYDALNRLRQQVDPLQGEIQVEYNGQDRLSALTDPLKRRTTYRYNGFGDVIQKNSPDTGISVYVYDAAGNLIKQTDANGVTVEFEYDALNRLTQRRFASDSSETTRYEYDSVAENSAGIGQLSRVSLSNGDTQEFHYRAGSGLGQVISRIGGKSYTTHYAYDSANRLDTITYPSGRRVHYQYNILGQIATISTRQSAEQKAETVLTDINYPAFAVAPSDMTFGNGLSLSLSFDGDGWLESLNTEAALEQRYRYDLIGNLTAITEPSADKALDYDALSRITQAQTTIETTTETTGYAYDANGNRLNQTRDNQTDDYTYATDSGRLLSTGQYRFDYDANGNTLKKLSDSQSGEGLYLSYGVTNRLMQVKQQLADGSQVERANYHYNTFGQRDQKITGDGSTHYLYGTQGELLAEYDINTARWVDYIYLGGRLVALADTEGDNEPPVTPPPTGGGDKPDPPPTDGGGDSDGGGGGGLAWIVVLLMATLAIALRRYRPAFKHLMVTSITLSLLSSPQWVHNVSAATVENTKAGEQSSHLLFIHTDHLGTPQRVTNDTGQIVWQASYQTFGLADINDDPDGDGDGEKVTLNVRFPGQYFDGETGLHYNYFRYYDPATGRYITSDPIGLVGGLNTYTYVGGNPLNRIDPTGEFAVAIPFIPTIVTGMDIAIGALIAAVSSIPGDSAQTQDRAIPQPTKPKRGVTCTCRASSSGQQEGNCPEDEFSYGTATAPTYRQARAEAERIARRKLGKQAKHTQCKCTDNKGNPIRDRGR